MPKSSWPPQPNEESRKFWAEQERKKNKPRSKSALDGILNDAKKAFAPGIATGFDSLDKAVRLSPGRLIILGARPGIGKTTLATQIAAQVLQGHKYGTVLYCSVEMDAAEIGLKALSCISGFNCITPYEEEDETMIEHVSTQATFAANTLARLEVLYGMSLEAILEDADRHSRDIDDPLLLIVIDFITSIQPIGEYATKSEAVGSVSRALKALAKRLQVPVLCCAQLNRATAAGKVPTMKDLRDSGEIEQDADTVLILHRSSTRDGRVEVLIDKNRFGTLDSVILWPELHLHRFKEE